MNLCEQRKGFHPKPSEQLSNPKAVGFDSGKPTQSLADSEEIQKRFSSLFGAPILRAVGGDEKEFSPLKVGVVFSGGQASGGHNVIAGLYDALKDLNSGSTLIGFLNGPIGIVENQSKSLEESEIAEYRNQGGFDLLGSGRTKIESDQQLQASLKTVQDLDLDGLVVVGGDDSNTNAAVLAEYFTKAGVKTRVIGVPKTIDGDLQNEYVEISFGFDTACKCYSEMIGNICRDALSAKKYFHFVKLMGRSASHIALECALATHPNLTFIGEEEKSLEEIKRELIDVIQARQEDGMNFGVFLIPEGLIEFIPEMKVLIQELNAHLAGSDESPVESLSDEAKATYNLLPKEIQSQLLMDRDPHGNVQVSHIRTERLLISLVMDEVNISPVEHFFGYEGRAALPSNFDATYCYNLGLLGALLIAHDKTGYMCAFKDLNKNPENWIPFAVPITSLLNLEMRKGEEKPVIQKALVDLKGSAFKRLAASRASWKMSDDYLFPGPIQFFGPESMTDTHPHILSI